MKEGRTKMNDLRSRLRDIEGFAPPDLWKGITGSEPRQPPSAEPGPTRKFLIAAFAFAIALASVILVARAFGGREPQPTSKPPLTTGAVKARVADRIEVGRATTVAYGAGSVWVSVDPVDSSDRSILRIDPTTDEIVAKIPMPGVPGWEIGGGGLVVAEGSVWVAGRLDGAGSGSDGFITRIDPSTNSVIDTITLKEGDVADVAVDREAIWALIGNPGEPAIVRIDPSSREAVATIPLDGGYGRFIFAIGGSVLAAIAQPPGGPFDGGTLVRIDPTTNRVAGTFDLGTYPSVATGDGTMWAVTDSGLVQIDPDTGQPIDAPANVPCTGDALAAGVGGVWCFDPARDRALTRFNPRTAQVDVAMRPDERTGGSALTTSPGSIWVVNGEQLTRVASEAAG
jgi:streptogramin lyase